MNKVMCLSVVAALIGMTLVGAPLSAFAMAYNPAPGTPYYAAPQGYNSYFAGSYQQPQYAPQNSMTSGYGTQYYMPQTPYAQQPVPYYGPNVTVQPINYQPFTQTITALPQNQYQVQGGYASGTYGYGYQPQYSSGGYYSPSTGYVRYPGYYGAGNPPIDMGYATGDRDTFGSPICYYADYGRADCGSNPNQPVYDVWTGTWY